MSHELGFPDVRVDAVPWLSVEEMREVDRVMIEDLGITLVRMMENAGRSLAVIARRMLGGSAAGRRVTVLAGKGGNGGGGLVAARHLAVAGARVEVLLSSRPERLVGVPAEQLAILERVGVPCRHGAELVVDGEDLVIDALLGYSASGEPHGGTAHLVDAAAGMRVLSLDAPTGLELASGVLHEPHIAAAATLTLAAPKQGLRAACAKSVVGDLHVADISVPSIVYERLGHPQMTPFAAGPIIRLTN